MNNVLFIDVYKLYVSMTTAQRQRLTVSLILLKMDNLEDVGWVFDSLVGFLHGPVWNSPLQTFIEEKSIIFEPDDKNMVINEECKMLHERYKNLVDLMLGTFMEEIGILPEQFELACEMSKQDNGLPLHFHQRLFEQIWAANDLSTFIRMMTQRNVELQIQALELINDRRVNEAEVISSPEDAEVIQKIERMTLEEVCSSSNNKETEDSNVTKPTKEDFATRQKYLKSQRDKLVAVKRQIREKQLEGSSRPKSSKVALEVLSGREEYPGIVGMNVNVRKVLADRLRSEVVENTVE